MNLIHNGKEHFHEIPLNFRIYADLEADTIIDSSNIGNKANKVYKQKPVCNVYCIVSELSDVLRSGFYESNRDYDILEWFADEVIRLENKLVFNFKNTNKDINTTEEDEEHYRNTNICRFCERETRLNKEKGIKC